jgi:hypothetical protein
MKTEGQEHYLPKTLFIDIDGTILYHWGDPNAQTKYPPTLLKGVLEKLAEWSMEEYRIILVTGRKESERNATIKQLESVGIVYDMLIMGLGRGDRVIINDMKPNSNIPTAIAISLKRNEGICDIKL